MTIYISVEGQSEEVFAEHYLKPYLQDFGKFLKVITFGIGRPVKGGISSFGSQVAELKKIAATAKDRKYCITTMYDLADLHKDIPRYEEYLTIGDPYQKADFASFRLREGFPNPNFVPHYQLYQFETLIFSKPSVLLGDNPGKEQAISQLESQLEAVDDNPELINSINKPSYRIAEALGVDEKKFKGSPIGHLAGSLTIPFLKEKCRHFGAWITCLENL